MPAYEPGTVAAVQTSVIADDGGVAVRVKRYTLTNEPVWMWLTNSGIPRADGGFVRDENVTDIRPLVVIDPEDREQVERLCAEYLLCERGAILPLTSEQARPLMQAALREFANPTPPKPEEPTGLGAVVEDAEGVRWTRANAAGEWFSHNGDEVCIRWSEVAAVRVLSEGVQP